MENSFSSVVPIQTLRTCYSTLATRKTNNSISYKNNSKLNNIESFTEDFSVNHMNSISGSYKHLK